MRYPNIFGQRTADPNAEPAAPVVLDDDSNSVVDPLQPDVRFAKELNRRHFAVAESTPKPAPAADDESADE